MRKVPQELENPIDNIFINLSEKIAPLLYKLHITPNDITTLSFISGLISIYYLKKNNMKLFATWYLLGHFFDCMDGFYARKYDLVTDVGCIYDHSTDVIICILILYIFLKKKRNTLCNIRIICIILVFFILLFIYVQLQELYYDRMESPFLMKITNKKYSKSSLEPFLKVLRLFGPGTFILMIISMVFFNY
jgi:phosphatidylglycerophosphate synthase